MLRASISVGQTEMAERLDKEFSLLSTDTLSFPSSHSSTMSFSGFNRTESTSSLIGKN